SLNPTAKEKTLKEKLVHFLPCGLHRRNRVLCVCWCAMRRALDCPRHGLSPLEPSRPGTPIAMESPREKDPSPAPVRVGVRCGARRRSCRGLSSGPRAPGPAALCGASQTEYLPAASPKLLLCADPADYNRQ